MRRLSFIVLAAFLSIGTVPEDGLGVAKAQLLGSNSRAQSFLETAAMASRYAIASGQMALEKSQNPEVRRFAERMVADYTKAYDDLAQIAQHASLALPLSLGSTYQARLQKLETAPADAFDATFMELQAQAHWEATFYLNRHVRSDDPRVGAFAARMLPMLKAQEGQLQQFARR